MLLLREMVIITLFIVGYNITTGCVPGTYTKFYIYRIADSTHAETTQNSMDVF